MKLKTKAHPQKPTMNTDSSTAAALCPQNDLVCHHHIDGGEVMMGNIRTTNCETEHPGDDHTCTKDISEFEGFSSQNSVANVVDIATRHGSMYGAHRLLYSQLENTNNHQPLQLLSDGKPIT